MTVATHQLNPAQRQNVYDQIQIVIALTPAILAVNTQNPSSMMAFDALWDQVETPLGRRLPPFLKTATGQVVPLQGAPTTPAPALPDLAHDFLATHQNHPIAPHKDLPNIDHLNDFFDALRGVIVKRVLHAQGLIAQLNPNLIQTLTPDTIDLDQFPPNLFKSLTCAIRLLRAYAVLTSWPGRVPNSQDRGEKDCLEYLGFFLPVRDHESCTRTLIAMLQNPKKASSDIDDLDEWASDIKAALHAPLAGMI